MTYVLLTLTTYLQSTRLPIHCRAVEGKSILIDAPLQFGYNDSFIIKRKFRHYFNREHIALQIEIYNVKRFTFPEKFAYLSFCIIVLFQAISPNVFLTVQHWRVFPSIHYVAVVRPQITILRSRLNVVHKESSCSIVLDKEYTNASTISLLSLPQ